MTFLAPLELGGPIALRRHGLVLVPIVDPAPRPLDAFPLRWGIEHGRTRVTEIGDGRVDRVRVDHDGATPLLVLDGEEVVGAKQNRVFNASFLVPAGGGAELPVSCVEQQRWHKTSTTFASSGRTVITSVRTSKLHTVATSVMACGTYDTDQEEIWTGVAKYIRRTRVTSRTSSHAEAAEAHGARIDETLAMLRLMPGQVGVAAVDSSGAVTIDAFGAPGLLNRTWTVIARGLLADPRDGPPHPRAVGLVRNCLDALARVTPTCTPAPGIGHSLHAITDAHVAGAVAHEGRIYHLLAGTIGAAS